MNKLVYRYIIRHYQYVSFDVFDTLIERDVNRPSDIFVLVGKCILGKENAEKFRILRKKAEFEAREENNHKEITLDQIYEKLRGLYEEDVIEQLRKEEIQQEIKHCPRKENIAPLYQACVKKKKHILIISDMYLPSEVIQKMLKACNILDYEKIYVSNEYGVNKISGILFKKVIQDKKINAYEMIHIGDSIKADFLGARKARVKSVLIGRKNRFERLIHS